MPRHEFRRGRGKGRSRGSFARGRGNGRRTQVMERRPQPSRSVEHPVGYRLLVLVGIPGSGKSTLASTLATKGWTIVNQDKLGSRRNCEVRARNVLQQGGRVAIDRSNFDHSQRETWTKLATSVSLRPRSCVAVMLDVSIETCAQRVQSRAGHPTLPPGPEAAAVVARFDRDMRPPHESEGFHRVFRCKNDDELAEMIAVLSPAGGEAVTPAVAAAVPAVGPHKPGSVKDSSGVV